MLYEVSAEHNHLPTVCHAQGAPYRLANELADVPVHRINILGSSVTQEQR